MVGGASLNSEGDYLLCLSVSVLSESGLYLDYFEGGVVLDVLLYALKKLCLSLLGCAVRDALKLLKVLADIRPWQTARSN